MTLPFFGVGKNCGGVYKTSVNKIYTKEYALWHSMLTRCYSSKYHEKFPTYKICEMSDNFKDYQWFAEWCQHQTGFGLEGYHLDKDILIKGNKLYSEDTCVFVPRQLNLFFPRYDSARGKNPIGVCFQEKTGKFMARVSKYNKDNSQQFLGLFNTKEEAFLAYKAAKETILKELLEVYKELIDYRVVVALETYSVDISD